MRAKQAASGWLLDTAAAIVERARAAHALVIVNDRPDIARLANADGVHVGQDDLAPAASGFQFRERWMTCMVGKLVGNLQPAVFDVDVRPH